MTGTPIPDAASTVSNRLPATGQRVTRMGTGEASPTASFVPGAPGYPSQWVNRSARSMGGVAFQRSTIRARCAIARADLSLARPESSNISLYTDICDPPEYGLATGNIPLCYHWQSTSFLDKHLIAVGFGSLANIPICLPLKCTEARQVTTCHTLPLACLSQVTRTVPMKPAASGGPPHGPGGL